VKLTVAVVVKISWSRIIIIGCNTKVQWYESETISSRQLISNHKTTIQTEIQHYF